jgi:hypothetical protein
MMQSPDEKELRDRLEPEIHKFVQKVEKEGLQVSALIFDPQGGFLMRCGNAPQEGDELVRLHYFLSLICTRLEAQGQYERFTPAASYSGPSSEEIADSLAVALLAMPSELIPSQLQELAQQYAASRRPDNA